MEFQQQTAIVLKINTGVIAVTSIALTVLTMLWNVFYGYGKLSGKIDSMQEDITELKVNVVQMDDRINARIDKLEDLMDKGFNEVRQDLHKMDLRVTTLEQRKH